VVDRAVLAAASFHDGRCRGAIPQPLGLALGIVVLLELRVEPARGVLACLCAEPAMHLPVVAGFEVLDTLFAFDQDRERRGLNAPYGGVVETVLAYLVVERGHRPRAVDPDEPVRF